MDPKQQKKLIEAVADALEHTRDERDELLRARFSDSSSLEEARALLADAERTDLRPLTSHLEAQVAEAASAFTEAPMPSHIGPYLVMECLGEGGMGVVYRCRQTGRIERDVAVKVMRRAGGPRLLGRFEAEVRSLARLEHPAIAKVFDAGTTAEGLPYFSMEYVDGIGLLEACDARRLGIAARLDAFAELCDAVQFAHVRGVIHRDLKPSNVLATDDGGKIAPKIIDFGIAKDLELDGLHATAEGSVLGTLEYMSPEQARGEPGLDVRTDVYSLGMVLYELLTGVLPFSGEAFRTGSPLEVHRLVNETERPTPSARLSQDSESAQAAATRRSLTVDRLRRRLRGDLDWVVLKALEVDPGRRYQSAAEFADDVRRARNDEPVHAAPPSWTYRASKFARRNRIAVSAAGLVLLSTLGGSVAATVGFLRANEARAVAEREAERAAAVTDFVSGMISSVRPDEAQGSVVTMLEVLDSAAARLALPEREMEPTVEADIRMLIGESYQSLSRYDEALPLFLGALELRREQLTPSDPPLHSAISKVGETYWLSGRLDESLPYALELLEMRRETFGRFHADYVSSLNDVANTYADMGRLEEAEAMFREAEAVSAVVDTGPSRIDRAFLLNNMATVLVDRGKFEEAIPLHRESLALRRELMGDRSIATLLSLGNYAAALQGAGRMEEAEEAAREALEIGLDIAGPNHQRTAIAQTRLGSILLATGREAEAEEHLSAGLSAMRLVAPDSWRAGAAAAALAEVYEGTGRDGLAEPLLRGAWERYSEVFGSGDTRSVSVAARLAALLERSGSAEAATWQARASGD